MNASYSKFRHGQHGASLVVVMILLVVMTLLGLAVLRSTLLEERMTANLLDRSYGFQAAEAALREGEALAQLPATRAAVPSSGCTNGICAVPVGTAADRWLDTGFAGWRTGTAANRSAAAAGAEYIVEYMGDGETWMGCSRNKPISGLCLRPRFRITARSQDSAANNANGRAVVLLQTNYIAP